MPREARIRFIDSLEKRYCARLDRLRIHGNEARLRKSVAWSVEDQRREHGLMRSDIEYAQSVEMMLCRQLGIDF